MPKHTPTCLIVNADDFGYYRCTSRGIREAADRGVVTATGMLANSPHLEEHRSWLASRPGLDLGVHLNLSHGEPLSGSLRSRSAATGGQLPSRNRAILAVLTGALPLDEVREEWRQQIQRCLELGASLSFLNSHEHLHMLPALFPLVGELAEEFGIPHVRFSAPERPRAWSNLSPARDLLLGALSLLQRRSAAGKARLIGMSGSGKLDLAYLGRHLTALLPGDVYELMCHPGRLDPAEVRDPRLRSYHRWEQELEALMSTEFQQLLRAHGIELIGFRQLAFSPTGSLVRS